MKQLDLDTISLNSGGEDLLSTLLQDDEIHICISYISAFTSAKLLREFVDEVCKIYSISPKWRTRLVLIIDELNNNAIEYGSKQGENNLLELHLQKDVGKTVFIASVTDTGHGDHAKTSQQMEEIREANEKEDFSKHSSIRGRGLFLIISRLVDSLKFYNTDS